MVDIVNILICSAIQNKITQCQEIPKLLENNIEQMHFIGLYFTENMNNLVKLGQLKYGQSRLQGISFILYKS